MATSPGPRAASMGRRGVCNAAADAPFKRGTPMLTAPPTAHHGAPPLHHPPPPGCACRRPQRERRSLRRRGLGRGRLGPLPEAVARGPRDGPRGPGAFRRSSSHIAIAPPPRTQHPPPRTWTRQATSGWRSTRAPTPRTCTGPTRGSSSCSGARGTTTTTAAPAPSTRSSLMRPVPARWVSTRRVSSAFFAAAAPPSPLAQPGASSTAPATSSSSGAWSPVGRPSGSCTRIRSSSQ